LVDQSGAGFFDRNFAEWNSLRILRVAVGLDHN
jgi:hypothetical protein